MMLININIAWPKKRREIRDRQAAKRKYKTQYVYYKELVIEESL